MDKTTTEELADMDETVLPFSEGNVPEAEWVPSN